MRRIIRFLLWTLGAAGALQALGQTPVPIPVQGNLSSIVGNGQAYAGVSIQLLNCPSPVSIPGYSVIVQQGYQVRADPSGVVNTTVWSNDLIDCNGTLGNSEYQLSYVVNGAVQGTPQCYQVVSTQTWNLNTQMPIACTGSAPNPYGVQQIIPGIDCTVAPITGRGIVTVNCGGAIYPGVTSAGTGGLAGNPGSGQTWEIPPNGTPYFSNNPINVKSPPYNATGNGSTDDSAAIQSAINAAIASQQSVYLPSGNYKVLSALNLTGIEHALIFYGEGIRSTIITASHNGNVLDLTGSQFVTLQNFTINTGSSIPSVGILMARGYYNWRALATVYAGTWTQATVSGTPYLFYSTGTGVSGSSTPSWNATLSSITTDGGVSWVNYGTVAVNGAPSAGSNNVFNVEVNGSFSHTGYYNYASENFNGNNFNVINNYTGNSAALFTRMNILNITSAYASVATGAQSATKVTCNTCSFESNTTTGGTSALWIEGVSSASFPNLFMTVSASGAPFVYLDASQNDFTNVTFSDVMLDGTGSTVGWEVDGPHTVAFLKMSNVYGGGPSAFLIRGYSGSNIDQADLSQLETGTGKINLASITNSKVDFLGTFYAGVATGNRLFLSSTLSSFGTQSNNWIYYYDTGQITVQGNIANANGTVIPSTALGFQGPAAGYVQLAPSATGTPGCMYDNGSGTRSWVGCSGGSGISGLTPGYIPLAGSSTTLTGNSHLDDGVTTAGAVTSSEAFAVNCPTCPSQGSLSFNTGHPLVPGSSATVVWGPDASGRDMVSEGGGTAAERCNATNGVCASPVATINNSGAITVVAQNTFVNCTAACTITPLPPALNVQLCVRNAPDTNAVVTMAALGSGKSYELVDHSTYGTANHTVVSGGGSYDAVCWTGYSTTQYSAWNSSGTWTD